MTYIILPALCVPPPVTGPSRRVLHVTRSRPMRDHRHPCRSIRPPSHAPPRSLLYITCPAETADAHHALVRGRCARHACSRPVPYITRSVLILFLWHTSMTAGAMRHPFSPSCSARHSLSTDDVAGTAGPSRKPARPDHPASKSPREPSLPSPQGPVPCRVPFPVRQSIARTEA